MTDERVDNEAEKIQEYILSNGEELYQFFMANLSSLESVCNKMVKHLDDGCCKWGYYIIDAIIKEVKEESYEKARERVYGED